MKEIKITRTIEEVAAYEADDGMRFKTKEQCEAYETSARHAIQSQFYQLSVGKSGVFRECDIFENFGYGSEEYDMIVIEIKNENDLKIANMFAEMQRGDLYNSEHCCFKPSMIGQRILVGLGSQYDVNCHIYGTEQEMIDQFKRDMDKFFNPKMEESHENND